MKYKVGISAATPPHKVAWLKDEFTTEAEAQAWADKQGLYMNVLIQRYSEQLRPYALAAVLSVLMLVNTAAHALGPAGVRTNIITVESKRESKRPKKPFIKRFVIAAGACGLGIGLSANPATSAEIGVPILLGGNYFAYRLYQNHPKWSAFIQAVSPLGCFGYKHAKVQAKKNSTSLNPNPSSPPAPANPPSGGSGSGGLGSGGRGGPPPSGASGSGGSGSGGSGSGGSGSGGSGSVGSGSGGSGSGGSGSGGSGSGGSGSGGSGSGGSGSGGSGSGGSGSGGSGSGGSGSGGSGSGPGGPPAGGRCIQDCGLRGNGGINTGNDLKKPPFPGVGPQKP